MQPPTLRDIEFAQSRRSSHRIGPNIIILTGVHMGRDLHTQLSEEAA